MARFNKVQRPTQMGNPIVTATAASGLTGNGAPGFAHDVKSELFLLAVQNFVGQNTFYEKAETRDARFVQLVQAVTAQDPDWMRRFLPWLRNEANMRTASLIGAVEAVREMVALKIPGGRQLIDSVIQRADEPGEVLGYFMQAHGRKIPKPVKRGVADAATRLYNEFNLLKYDTTSHGIRFGDVLDLTHPSAKAGWQSHLFRYALERRHNRDEQDVSRLPMVSSNMMLRSVVAGGDMSPLLDPDALKEAGFTWEDALSLGGKSLDKKALWEAMIPNMGYMALLRNLRNFDESGVSDAVAQLVTSKLEDPDQVARSRQLPLRFLSAFRATSNLRWAMSLQKALEWSLQNVPYFPGRTLILIDTSGSMNSPFSKDGTLRFYDAAALFGLAVAKRCERPTVVSFSGDSKQFPLKPGSSLLLLWRQFMQGYLYGAGTATKAAVDCWFGGHDRVIVLTDEQANSFYGHGDVFSSVPNSTFCLTFNLAGYRWSHAAGGHQRATIGGLSDQAFKLLPVLEARHRGQWPF